MASDLNILLDVVRVATLQTNTVRRAAPQAAPEESAAAEAPVRRDSSPAPASAARWDLAGLYRWLSLGLMPR